MAFTARDHERSAGAEHHTGLVDFESYSALNNIEYLGAR